jgi:diguanylate cyclase (GGDEF)-like protein
MDPRTVIVMLAFHLVASGGLMFAVWRVMPSAPGLGRWALASGMFGIAYLGRLAAGFEGVDFVGLMADSLMVLAVLLFREGVREFAKRQTMPLSNLASLWALIFAAEAAAAAAGGAQARHVALNLAIGLLYASIAWTLAVEVRRQPMPLRSPLRLLAALLGGLAALTMLRVQSIAADGMAVAFHGLLAQVFYVYASLTAVMVAFSLLWIMFLRFNEQLLELATRDALTGVLNRNGLDRALKRHFAKRGAAPMILLLADIDHFKRINDTFGHASGDAMLRAVTRALTSQLRAGDFVARMGGEEFLICCVGARQDVALALAHRLHSSVGQVEVKATSGDASFMCTVSVGVSMVFSRYADWELAASQADRALYEVKAAGRDGVRPFAEAIVS